MFKLFSYPSSYLFSFEIADNKKRARGNPLYELVFNSRGDRIRTYDLVLPKHPVRNLRQTPEETSEAIAYELVLLGFI